MQLIYLDLSIFYTFNRFSYLSKEDAISRHPLFHIAYLRSTKLTTTIRNWALQAIKEELIYVFVLQKRWKNLATLDKFYS